MVSRKSKFSVPLAASSPASGINAHAPQDRSGPAPQTSEAPPHSLLQVQCQEDPDSQPQVGQVCQESQADPCSARAGSGATSYASLQYGGAAAALGPLRINRLAFG